MSKPQPSQGGKKPGFAPCQLGIAHTEASCAKRLKLIRGTVSIRQMETAHILAHAKIRLPERPRKNYEGTSCGDTLTGVVMPDPAEEWMVTWKEKKDLLGKRNLILVGGKGEQHGEEQAAERRTDTTLVPVCYRPTPEKFYSELLWLFFGKLVIDLSPTDAKFALACLKARVGYVGIAFTETHADLMKQYLYGWMKTAMAEPDSGVYNAAYAAEINGGGPGPEDDMGEGGAKPKAKAKGKAKAAGKPRAKATGKSKAKAAAKAAAAATDAETEEVEVLGDEDDDEEVWDPLAAEEEDAA